MRFVVGDRRAGFTLVELLVVIAITAVLALVAAVVLIGAQRAWQRGYEQAHGKINEDAQMIMVTLGSVGRKSNRLGYTLYRKTSSGYIAADTGMAGGGERTVYGDAVEFRYWSADEPTEDLLDVTNLGTDYAFFYIDDDQNLMVDYGPVPPGAVPGGWGDRNTTDVTTVKLAENVIPDPNGAFCHTMVEGVGRGCVRINVTLQDEDNPEEQLQVVTATLLRNIWPR